MVDAKFPGVQVVVPANPGSAVLYGAALYGTSPSVVGSRVMRYTYGFESNLLLSDTRFRGIDESAYSTYIDTRGNKRLRDGFLIMIAKDASLDANKSVSQIISPTTPAQTSMCIRIFSSDSENPIVTHEKGSRLIGDVTIHFAAGTTADFEVKFLFGTSEISVTVTDSETKIDVLPSSADDEQVERVLDDDGTV
ncbi:hypothetical protein BC828DRAFT_382988 [Blastocladiella britannica]|nr:hypothetical protein BC828DRAFT_382988 [Blastocladiella britannica]